MLMSDIASDHWHRDPDRMRDRFVMKIKAQRRQKPTGKKQTNSHGLHDCGKINRNEPGNLMMQGVISVIEHEHSVQRERCHHAQQVGCHDGRNIMQPLAEDDSRAKIDGGREAAGQDEKQELA